MSSAPAVTHPVELVIRRSILYSVVYAIFGLFGTFIAGPSLFLPGPAGGKIFGGIMLIILLLMMGHGALGFFRKRRAGCIVLDAYRFRWIGLSGEHSLPIDDVRCFEVEKDTSGDGVCYNVIARMLDTSRHSIFDFEYFRSDVLKNAVEICAWLEEIRKSNPEGRPALFAAAPESLRAEAQTASQAVAA